MSAAGTPWLWPDRTQQAPPDGSQLGSLLRRYRALRGLTQTELASRLAISQPQLSRIECGARRVRDVGELRRLAARLGIPAQELGVLPNRSRDALPSTGTVSTEPGAVRESQQRWRDVRRTLAAHRLDLAPLAAGLYPDAARVQATAVLAGPGWVPRAPAGLDDVALTWHPQASPPRVTGDDPSTGSVRPLSATGGRYDRYSRALRDLDRPRLLENRPGYRLLSVGPGGGGMTLGFGYTTYFENLDVSEALGHELAAAWLAGDPSTGRLPLRAAVGDPFDLAARPVMPSFTTLTIRHDARGGHRFPLMRRDGGSVAVCGGMLHGVPGGMFQPSSLAPSAQSADFDLWRSIMREYSEELLGRPEHDGNSVEPVDYAAAPFRDFDDARRAGRFRVHVLGVVVEPVTLWVDVLTVAVVDAPVFDTLFADMVPVNDEGRLVSCVDGDPRAGIPFEPAALRRLGDEAVAPLTAACLALAFRHRDALLG